jgi:hypothetical protein
LAHPFLAGLHNLYGNGLLVRLQGRLVEVAGIPAQLRQLTGLIFFKKISIVRATD